MINWQNDFCFFILYNCYNFTSCIKIPEIFLSINQLWSVRVEQKVQKKKYSLKFELLMTWDCLSKLVAVDIFDDQIAFLQLTGKQFYYQKCQPQIFFTDSPKSSEVQILNLTFFVTFEIFYYLAVNYCQIFFCIS